MRIIYIRFSDLVFLCQQYICTVKNSMINSSSISDDDPIRLASRASPLALVQTEEVSRKLAPLHSEIRTFSTRGDEVLDRSLADIGGKGLFIKTLEKAILAGEADAAVHAAKDMESHFADGTSLVAFLKREDRRDALIGAYDKIDALPQGGVLGTASVRRATILKTLRPDLQIKLLRGNIDSRLKQLTDGHYDAIILAMAGLNRLGISKDVHPIEEDVMCPAAGQGGLAIQVVDHSGDDRHREIITALSNLNHGPSAAEITAERAVLQALDGTCHTPVAASAHFHDAKITMTAKLMSLDGVTAVEVEGKAPASEAAAIGKDLGLRLLDAVGGHAFIKAQQPSSIDQK
jgi:hydroxymethylbilane synthase